MFFVHVREILGELILNYLANTTLPKLFANKLGNVFVPNGTYLYKEPLLIRGQRLLRYATGLLC